MNELVSIVVPIYNMGDSIEICVKSLLRQTYKNIEIILVDDGSKDNSLEVCNSLAEKDSRIKVYHTENKGSGLARNYGIENSKGKYIFFPDADDYLEDNAISVMVEAVKDGVYDTVVFGFRSLNQNGNEVKVKKYPDMEKGGEEMRCNYSDYVASTSKYGVQGAPWNKLFSLDVIKKYNVKYPPLRRHQDDGFIARYMCHSQKVHFIESILYVHYVNDLKKEWKKYPVDYLDAVIGLDKVKKETILKWNSEDKKTHDMVNRDYICSIIKALELSFSPKMKFDKKSRKEWMKNAIKKSGIEKRNVPENLKRSYQEKVMYLILKKHYRMLYSTLYFKTFIEKNFYGVFSGIKKLMMR